MEQLKKLGEFLHQYRYAALVLLLGIGLMLLPNGSKAEEAPAVTASAAQESLTDQLEQLLTAIEGVGKVQVLLTTESGPQTVYRQDGDGTVIITDADRQQQGLVDAVLSERYRGAVIVCQGADRSAVKLAVVEAVASATGLSTDRIVVLKMK